MRCRRSRVQSREVYDSVPDNREAALEVRSRENRRLYLFVSC